MKYNKGEWSEAYAFIKLLGDGKVYAADENLEKIEKEYYTIIKFIKEETETVFFINSKKKIIQIRDYNNAILGTIQAEIFKNTAQKSISKIKNGTGTTFIIEEIENLLKQLKITKFKSNSQKKYDLKMEIMDHKFNKANIHTFSVKSQMGSGATILNASNATNFKYKIKKISKENIEEIKSIKKQISRKWLKDRMALIQKNNIEKIYETSFVETVNDNFGKNLRLIDSRLPEIISSLLMIYYSNTGKSDIKVLTELLTDENPLKLKDDEKYLFYKTKIIEFIKASTLGMMPSQEWDKTYTVTGGILTVKKNGEVLCHHIFYDAKNLDEYLYQNTKLETASTTRYNTGEINREVDGSYYFTLNLQIRMKN